MKRYIHFRFSKILNFEKMEKWRKIEKNKASKSAQQSQKVSRSTSQQASKSESQQPSKPAGKLFGQPSQKVSQPASQLASQSAPSQQDRHPASQQATQRPSVRVSRAETRLTVYRSAYIRMLCQLVASFLVERLSVYFDNKMMLLRSSTWKVGWEAWFFRNIA